MIRAYRAWIHMPVAGVDTVTVEVESSLTGDDLEKELFEAVFGESDIEWGYDDTLLED